MCFFVCFFAVTFQFSGGIYLASVSQMVGSLALMQEDIMMAGYASFVGQRCFPYSFSLEVSFHFPVDFLDGLPGVDCL